MQYRIFHQRDGHYPGGETGSAVDARLGHSLPNWIEEAGISAHHIAQAVKRSYYH